MRKIEISWPSPFQAAPLLWTVFFVIGAVNYGNAGERVKLALLRPEQASESRLIELSAEGITGVVLTLTDTNAQRGRAAAERVLRTKLDLSYWIEVARNPSLADAHPEWMASIQTHQGWRRLFPRFPKPASNEVVKAYPWVPALYQETFDLHLRRISKLLQDQPKARRVFLNDLQGPPSACGCGHHLCRWTTDYGPLTSATRLPNETAGKFVGAVKRLAAGVDVVPVWATECEERDKDSLCAGVGCFRGKCWREWTEQLMPVAAEARTVAALLPYRAFERDLPHYGPTAGWVRQGLHYFQQMPARYQADGVEVGRLMAVVQGWDVSAEQIQAQITAASEAGAVGAVVAYAEIDQGWEPRIHRLPEPKQ